jgi:hypothetical protein
MRTRLNIVYTYVHCLSVYVEHMFRILLFDVVHSLQVITRRLEKSILRWKEKRLTIIWMALQKETVATRTAVSTHETRQVQSFLFSPQDENSLSFRNIVV